MGGVVAIRWSPAYALGLVTFRRRDAACAAAVAGMDASLCSSEWSDPEPGPLASIASRGRKSRVESRG
jgi:hypothetical protein